MSEKYEYVRVYVDCDELSWKYKLVGGIATSMSHDEDVSDWSERDIVQTTRMILDIPEDVEIEVIYA